MIRGEIRASRMGEWSGWYAVRSKAIEAIEAMDQQLNRIERDEPAPACVPVLECRNLCISYFTRAGEIPAVVDFNLKLMPGEAQGIVGESGCGKSTVALAIMQYLGKNGNIVGGEILFEGRDMTTMSEEELRQIRGSKIAMVYQEPMASLNPAMTDRRAARRSADLSRRASQGRGAGARAQDAGERARARSRPHHGLLSAPDFGRPAAARRHRHGAAVEPEAAAARRADHRARRDGGGRHRRADQGDRRKVRHLDDLHLAQSRADPRDLRPHHRHVFRRGGGGRARSTEVFEAMRHPYTRGLFASIPVPGADKNARPLVAIPGQLPLPHQRPPGCNFGPRCTLLRRRALRRRRDPDGAGRRAATSTPRAASASTRSTGTRAVGDGVGARADRAGRRRAQGRRPHQALRDRAGRDLLRRRDEDGEGEREAELRGARGGDGRHRRRIRLRQVDLRQGADGPGDGDRAARSTLGNLELGHTAGREARRGHDRQSADGLPEPVRHAQSEPFGRLADRPRHPQVRRRDRRGRRCRRGS